MKSPIRKIGGFGEFVQYIDRPVSEAWSKYGKENGVSSLSELGGRIAHFAAKNSKSFTADPIIGCIELSGVVILDEDQFVTPEQCGHHFSSKVVRVKYFQGNDGIAQKIGISTVSASPFELVVGTPTHKKTIRKERKGQAAFRQLILNNYGFKCAVTGEQVAELLEAAHIQPYVDQQSNHSQNGICLRVDFHKLFDEGLISVSDAGTLLVNHRLANSTYCQFQNKPVQLPANASLVPSPIAMKFHREQVFRSGDNEYASKPKIAGLAASV